MEVYNFKATINNEIFYSDDSHWGVFSFTTEDEIPHVTKSSGNRIGGSLFSKREEGILSGQMQRLNLGMQYNVRAELKKAPKYGWQYIPMQIMIEKPNNEEEQMLFLESVISKKDARKIITAHPDFINEIVNGKIDFIINIATTKLNAAILLVQENYLLADIFALLTPMGITYKMIKKITSDVSNPVLLKEMLNTNPYILTRINGLGFKKIDQLALKINPKLRISEFRVRALITYTLKEASFGDGHTLLPLSQIKIKLNEIMPEASTFFNQVFDMERIKPYEFYIKGNMIGLIMYYKSESEIYERIHVLKKNKLKISVDSEKAIAVAEGKLKIKFTEEQLNAIKASLETNFVVITGSAGTGKSTVVAGLLELYKGKKIGICALAAKAAQRVTEITGHPASTIHKILEWQGDEFMKNKDNPLLYSVIIVDEASMINLSLFKNLLNAIKDTSKIIIVFDHAQLPPIGAGNVATDILALEGTSISKFTKIHRQAQKSGILMDANKIRNSIQPLSNNVNITTGELKDMHYRFYTDKNSIREFIIRSYFSAIKKHSIEDVIIILPRKKIVINSTIEINKEIQKRRFDEYITHVKIGKRYFYVGDKVIQRVNNYDLGVVNGEIGYVQSISQNRKYLTVKFNENKNIKYGLSMLKDLDLAYALTVHSYQGSQSKIVIVGIDYSHYILLDNCLLYTAITRASKECLIVAEEKAFKFAVKNNKNRTRKTFLKKIIAKEILPFKKEKKD